MSDHRTQALAGSIALLALSAIASAASAGTVYTESNSANGNEIQLFSTGAAGELTALGAVSTGGLGTSTGLGNQGALALSADGRWLYAVNAGSNDISVFDVSNAQPILRRRVASGGAKPISLTLHDDLLYVLNAGGSGNIAGFGVSGGGRLRAIPGSARPLSSATSSPAQISFDNEGESLLVTEKATNRLTVYRVHNGLASEPRTIASHGATPFGFAFARHDTLLVSEAFGGQAGASALSSYDVDDDAPTVRLVDGSVPTLQTAACWVIVSHDGRYAYVTNTGSGTVSGFGVRRDGHLSRLASDGVSGITGGGPTDGTTSADGRLLYVLSPTIGSIVSFQIMADGSLRRLSSVQGAAGSSTGLVAR